MYNDSDTIDINASLLENDYDDAKYQEFQEMKEQENQEIDNNYGY